MDATGRYEQLALDCLNLADAARDPTVREQLLHRAEYWARLAAADVKFISAFWPAANH
jgi:hypothetical protein